MPIELCLFDLDDTLVKTADMEAFRGTANVRNTTEGYIRGVRSTFSGRPCRHIYSEGHLRRLRAEFPKMKWGVFTRAPRAYCTTVLETAYPEWEWDVVVAREDVRNTKPSPDGIQVAMHRLGVDDPRRVMLVGDSKPDIMSAYHAGIWVTLDQASWSANRSPDNWYCLERLPDAIISSPHNLGGVLSDPGGHAPLMDQLAWRGSGPSSMPDRSRIERINHFKPRSIGKGTYPIHCLGRMFGGYESLEPRARWHALTEEILSHKDATSFPESWHAGVRAFLDRDFAGRQASVVVTVIPAKPGRAARLEAFVKQLGNYVAARPIRSARIEFIPDALAYRPGARSHHGEHLSRTERFENVRDNLVVRDSRKVAGKCVVVIDDVVTTGATLIYAKDYLQDAGAVDVRCLAIAKAIGDV